MPEARVLLKADANAIDGLMGVRAVQSTLWRKVICVSIFDRLIVIYQ
jgi:hypothetical protein